MVQLDALDELEARAIREKQLATYNTALGSASLFSFAVLALTLPSPWRVINGEWSSRVLPSLLALCGASSSCTCLFARWRDTPCVCVLTTPLYALAGHGVWVLSAVLALKCAQVQGSELLRELHARVPYAPSTHVHMLQIG